MKERKLSIRTLANEWFEDFSKINYDVYHLDYEKKNYEDIITFLKNKYKVKEKQINSKSTAFEFERRGYKMDVFVSKQASGKANVLSRVICHFTDTPEGCYRVSINKLITNDTQKAIQNKFPELFDNKTVYFIEAVELPIVKEQDEVLSIHDSEGLTSTEFTEKTEAIESARILAQELSQTHSNCCCITVIQGISNCRKRCASTSKYRRERDIFTIGTKSIPEVLLARRRYQYYPITVDEYVEQGFQDHQSISSGHHIYVLTVAINDNRQFTMTTLKFYSKEEARNAAENVVLDWAESNQREKYSFDKFEYEYKINTPDLIEVYSKRDKKRLTAMLTEISLNDNVP